VEVGAALERRRNPAFEEDDSRRRAWVRAEHATGPIRTGVGGGWEHVSFAGASDDLRLMSADVTIDTRIDPALPRQAVYATAGWTHIAFASGGAANRAHLEARGYLGLVGQSSVMVSIIREDSDAPLPPYLKSLLGGWDNLRGFRAGAFAGDTMVAATVELRVPLNSPLAFGRFGASAFVDTGRAYDKGQRLRDGPRATGVGGGVWLVVSVIRLGVTVAHGLGADTRVSFGAALSY